MPTVMAPAHWTRVKVYLDKPAASSCICTKKIIQSHVYHKDAYKMRLDHFLYARGYAAMQVCLDPYACRATKIGTAAHQFTIFSIKAK